MSGIPTAYSVATLEGVIEGIMVVPYISADLPIDDAIMYRRTAVVEGTVMLSRRHWRRIRRRLCRDQDPVKRGRLPLSGRRYAAWRVR